LYQKAGDSALLLKFAEDEKTSGNILAALSFHNDKRIRAALADNSNTPLVTLYKLAGDESLDVRCQLAESTNVPARILLVLASDEDRFV